MQFMGNAMFKYADDLRSLRAVTPAVADQIAGFRTLEHILDWMKREGHSLAALDMVTQDEYCHDLLMPIGENWLVFGMT
jgi:uncharacterized radical SAM superfamily protein